MENFNDYFHYQDGKLFWKINRKSNKVEGKEAGHINAEGYRKVAVNKKYYGCHRIIFWMFNGYMPKKIDHKKLYLLFFMIVWFNLCFNNL